MKNKNEKHKHGDNGNSNRLYVQTYSQSHQLCVAFVLRMKMPKALITIL